MLVYQKVCDQSDCQSECRVSCPQSAGMHTGRVELSLKA